MTENHTTDTAGGGLLVPVVFSLLVPGTGHVYISHWQRGLVWWGLYIFSWVVLSGFSPVFDGTVRGPTSPISLPGGFHPVEFAFPVSILILCLVDLYIFRRFA